MKAKTYHENKEKLDIFEDPTFSYGGLDFDNVRTWTELVPNLSRAEVYRRLWYMDGKKKCHIPRGMMFDCSPDCIVYPRDGGVGERIGWHPGFFHTHHPEALICGRLRYGKHHTKSVCMVPPMGLDRRLLKGGNREMHLKGILNGLAHMCWLALEGKESITTCDLVEDFANAIFDDLLSAEKKGRDYDQLRTECELKAKIVIANYLNWHEGWVKAGQPIAPEVEK